MQSQETEVAIVGKALAVAGLIVLLFVNLTIGAILLVVGIVVALAGGAR